MRKKDTSLKVKVNSGVAEYEISITKPEGFFRSKDGVKVSCDGQAIEGTAVPVFSDGKLHKVEVKF